MPVDPGTTLLNVFNGILTRLRQLGPEKTLQLLQADLAVLDAIATRNWTMLPAAISELYKVLHDTVPPAQRGLLPSIPTNPADAAP